MKNNALMQLVVARLREFMREPAAIFWVYGFPLIMALALGLAFREKPVEQTVRIDVEPGVLSSEIESELGKQERFLLEVHDEVDWRRRLRTGDCDLVVIAPTTQASTSGDDRSLSNDSDQIDNDQIDGEQIDGEQTDGSDATDAEKGELAAELEFVFDPTRPGSVVARDAVNAAIQKAAGREDAIVTRDQEFKEPGGRYIDFLIPGLLGMSLMGGGLWGVGFAIVDLRIRKLLKRFVATPMRRSHFLAATMISRMIFMIPEMVLLIVFARIFFDVQVYGNWFSVIFVILLGSVQFSGIGLLLACRAQTLESISGLMNLAMLPMWIGSGVFFKAENFPDFLQPAITFLPLTPLIRALRGIMLDGDSLFAYGPELLMMTAWGAVSFVAGLYLFRWK